MAVAEINVAASGGGNIPCIAACPAGAKCTAVVVVPPIFGVNDDMAMVAERLAAEGFTGFVLDPFWRDEDQGVLTAVVNTFLELARKNAKNYLP